MLLDCFTVYGTQIFWPLPVAPVGWSTIFIIDPLYTVPLLVGVIAALIAGRSAAWGWRLNAVGLTLASLYLSWSVGAKLHVEAVAHDSLQRQGLRYERLLTTPAPFNTLLWRVVAMDGEGYYEGFYSLLDERRELAVTRYPSAPGLLEGIEDAWAVRRLQWFTRGFYAVGRKGGPSCSPICGWGWNRTTCSASKSPRSVTRTPLPPCRNVSPAPESGTAALGVGADLDHARRNRAILELLSGRPKDLARPYTESIPFGFARFTAHRPIAVPTIATRLPS